MKKGYLSDYFKGIAIKRLSAVEVDPLVSHQHEINGISELKNLLGFDREEYGAKFIYLGDDEEENKSEIGYVTWYDARENHPVRSEYRLYYSSVLLPDFASEGDLLVIGMRSDNQVIFIIVKAGSAYENNIQWLFNFDSSITENFSIHEINKSNDTELDYSSRFILSELGIEIHEVDENYLELMLSKFNKKFPSTHIFSEFARNSLGEISINFDPDQALIEWMDQEEILFRTLENHLIEEKIKKGFEDVDSFIEFSLSIQNRRKSRVGHALENHFEQILIYKLIPYSRGKITENKARPDFIFPDIDSYHDSNFQESRLTMLGVKSTCKDRWRQVLSEASRIRNKHLLTLEPGISENQTNEMKVQNLQLVVPENIFDSYNQLQQKWLINVKSFIELVQKRNNQQ